jgi:hypothetical protein
MVLIEGCVDRGGLAVGDNALDPDARSREQFAEFLIRGLDGKIVEQVRQQSPPNCGALESSGRPTNPPRSGRMTALAERNDLPLSAYGAAGGVTCADRNRQMHFA